MRSHPEGSLRLHLDAGPYLDQTPLFQIDRWESPDSHLEASRTHLNGFPEFPQFESLHFEAWNLAKFKGVWAILNENQTSGPFSEITEPDLDMDPVSRRSPCLSRTFQITSCHLERSRCGSWFRSNPPFPDRWESPDSHLEASRTHLNGFPEFPQFESFHFEAWNLAKLKGVWTIFNENQSRGPFSGITEPDLDMDPVSRRSPCLSRTFQITSCHPERSRCGPWFRSNPPFSR